MSRKYPKFLWSKPVGTKSSGEFVIHALPPRFISRLIFDKKRKVSNVDVLEVWETDNLHGSIRQITDQIPKWFEESGRLQSCDPIDILMVKLKKLDSLKDIRSHFTVEEAAELIGIVFTKKTKGFNKSRTSYGLKHMLEKISSVNNDKMVYKYCSNNTLIEAMALAGFNSERISQSPNYYFNVSSKDLSVIEKVFY